MTRWLGCALAMLCAVSGCGAERERPADDAQAQRFTLSGVIGATQGVVLETGSVVGVSWEDIGESDIYLTLKMSMMLNGIEDNAFCHKGEGFATVEQITPDEDGCEWKSLTLGGNSPDATRGVQADGYLFFEADRERLHRLLVVEHSIDADGVGRVTFDVMAAD